MKRSRSQQTVALVLPNLELGGAERQAVELALQLPALGWRVVVMVAEKHGPLEQALTDAGIAVHDLRAELWHPKGSLAFWKNVLAVVYRIRRICSAERVSILQSYLYWQNQLVVPAGMFNPGVKAVITGRRSMGSFKDGRRGYQLIENLANLFTDAIVCNSKAVALDTLNREHTRSALVSVIYNGVDTDTFHPGEGSPQPTLREKDELVVGTVGNLKPEKNQSLLIRAFARAAAGFPRARLVIAGRDMGEGEKLRVLATELGVADRVQFAGEVSDAASFHRSLDLFVLSSSEEGMPNVVLEAMASGLPVVTTRVGGIRALIRSGKQGIVVKVEDEAGLADAVRSLLADPALRAELGAAALRRIRSRFSSAVMAGRYSVLYKKLIGKPVQ